MRAISALGVLARRVVKVAIKRDSYKHHVEGLSPSDFEYQKRRERFLQADGWTAFPFCGREINGDSMKCVFEVQTNLRWLTRGVAAPQLKGPAALLAVRGGRPGRGPTKETERRRPT